MISNKSIICPDVDRDVGLRNHEPIDAPVAAPPGRQKVAVGIPWCRVSAPARLLNHGMLGGRGVEVSNAGPQDLPIPSFSQERAGPCLKAAVADLVGSLPHSGQEEVLRIDRHGLEGVVDIFLNEVRPHIPASSQENTAVGDVARRWPQRHPSTVAQETTPVEKLVARSGAGIHLLQADEVRTLGRRDVQCMVAVSIAIGIASKNPKGL